MSNYSCLIVEDEPLAAEVLRDYVRQVPFLELRSVCTDAIYAMEYLQRGPIDLLFLDLHLPRLKGFDFLESLKTPPRVIITSAYPEYALQAFEWNVIDYLLKPVRFNRFLKAVNKLKEAGPVVVPAASGSPAGERAFYFFSVGRKKVKVFLDEILYIESMREYVRILTPGQTILTKFPLNEIEELLSRNNFLRIHRSFIVARDKINAFTPTDVEIGDVTLPIGRSYKELVVSLLEKAADRHK